MASSARLKYKIVKCTSEDPEYPVSELLSHSSQTKGWQTARFCDFPQELVLQFETPVHLRQVQFLSHQSKIATKIELFTFNPPEGQEWNLNSAQFKRLGYLSLDNNERSQFQARELKSVYVDVPAQCLRILFHKCHTNRYNIVNQVGLIALNCLGEALGPDLAAGQPPPNPALARGPPAAPAKPQQQAAPQQAPPDQGQDAAQAAADESRYDGKTLERIRALTVAKQRAVEAEDYEEAKRCKELLARLRQTGLMLRELEDRKKAAVQNEDYDAAKALKVEIERLRMSIERPQAANDDTPGSGPSSRASPVDAGPPADHGEAKAQDWAAPPQQMTAPRGVHQPRMENTPRAFSTQENDGGPPGGSRVPGHGRPMAPQDLAARASSPMASQDAPGFGGRSMSPAVPPQASNPMEAAPPAREGAGSPPLPANGGARVAHSPAVGARVAHSPMGRGPTSQSPGGARVAHSPVGAAPPWGQNASAPPEQPAEREPPGASDAAGHPLAGVPNVDELSQPEPLTEKNEKEAQPLIGLFGEGLTQCLFSRTWNLRDAALQKVVLDLRAGAYKGTDPFQLLQGVCRVLQRAIPDKNVQVFLSCAPLLHEVCHRLLKPVRRQEVHQALEPMMPLLVDRLGDANARVDKTARDAHIDFARCATVGAPFTTSYVLRPPKKKTVPAKVFSSRLQLLAALVSEVGIQPDSREGLPLEPTMQAAMDWFSNSNADVRESAVKLVGACYARVGLQRIEPYLANLRQVQREVFDTEFEKISNEDAGATDVTMVAPGRGVSGGREHAAHAGHQGAGWGDMPPPQVPPPRQAGAGQVQPQQAPVEEEDLDDTVCQFCGREDPTWTPETVDVHYWRECPMLIQCEFCQQVIEISMLHDHLREECESGQPAQAKAAEMVPNHCPLCRAAVGAGEDEDWRQHLLVAGCPKNPRDAYRRFCGRPGNVKSR